MKKGSLPGVGRTRNRAERQCLNTLPHLVLPRLWCSQGCGTPKSVVLSGGEGGLMLQQRNRGSGRLGHMLKIRMG